MQKIVDAFSNASKKFGLKINIKKTELLYQPNSTRTREEDIMVDGNKLNSVLEFTYLGSTLSSNGCIDDEIQRRMAKASASFCLLRQRLRNNHHVSMRVKGKIYRAFVLSTLLYGVTGEKAACLHDATSAFDHGDNLDGQSDKQGNTRTDRAAVYGRSDQKEFPVDWTPHEDVTRQAAKAGSLLSTVFWSQKERAPSSPIQGYHTGHHSHSREINGGQQSSDGSSLCSFVTDSTMMMMMMMTWEMNHVLYTQTFWYLLQKSEMRRYD